MGCIIATVGRHGRIIGSALRNKHLGIFTILDTLQGVAHGRTGLLIDNFRAGHVLAVFSVVGNRVVHIGNTALVHEIDNQLQLMQTLEIGHLRLVPGFHQCFKARLDQFDATATENRLLTEQVRFCFVLERCFNNTGAPTTNPAGIGQCHGFGLTGRILENCHQIGDTTTFGELVAYSVAGRLGCDHDHVQVRTRNYLVVMDSETVRECQRTAFLQIGLDLIFVKLGLEFVGCQDHHQISRCNSIGNTLDGQAGIFSFGRSG